MTIWGRIRRSWLGLPTEAASYTQRGFRGASPDVQRRFEQIGSTFLGGYHAALAHGSLSELMGELHTVEMELRGFAVEGAAMGLALRDRITPWRAPLIQQLLCGAGKGHAYMIHVGVGWVWARLPFGVRRAHERLDALLGWLAFDGWGFHEGYFHWPGYVAGKLPSNRLVGYARRVFDQGLGRSFWFVNGGNPALIASTINGLSAPRRPDLWSGIGLAATYAGIVDATQLHNLRDASGPFAAHLAQGSAFAAKARQRAGNLTHYTELATGVLCKMSALDAALLCDKTVENLPSNTPVPAYEIWRQRIQHRFEKVQQPQVIT
jgi:hypothetical protein